MREFESYEAFGAYHAAQLAQKEEEPNPLREFAVAFIGGAILTWAILSGGGVW